jgi:hypothetical protein
MVLRRAKSMALLALLATLLSALMLSATASANPGAPVILAESSADVTSSKAELSGEINPEGLETEYWFEYGERGTYTKKTATQKTVGASGPVSVGPVIITGLSPAISYSYRLVAKNTAGETKDTEDKTFTSEPVPPSVISESVSRITEGYVTLEAQISPGGEATYYAEYGTSPCGANACGTKSPEGFLIADTQEAVTLGLANVKPNTTYHYWVVALNSAAPAGVHGEAQEFTTPRSWEEIRGEEDEHLFKQRVQEEAKAKAETEARFALAAKEHQEEEAAAAKKRQEEQASASKASVRIVKVKASSSGLAITLDASKAGTVTISGPGLKTTAKKVAAGTNQIKVMLTKTGKHDREHHKKVKLTVQLKAAGKTVSESKTVKL